MLWRLLASLLHPLSVPQNYIVLFHGMIPDPWLGHCTDYYVVYLYFTWTQPLKIKVNFFVLMTMAHMGRDSFTPIILHYNFRWRWVVRFLNAATTFPSNKELVPLNMRVGWPLNQSECSVEGNNLLYLRGIWRRLPRPVFLNRWAAARYWAQVSIIPGRERFYWNLSF